jgi:hypothetical protein
MKITKQRLKQIIKEELDATLNEADRMAGQSIPSQIMRLDPNFKFDKQPTRGSDERLMVLQDIEGNTATVFNYEGEVMGTGLDLNSSPKWLDSIVRYSPGLVKASMREKYGR